MKGAARDRAGTIANQLLGATEHLLSRATGEREQQNRARGHAALDKPRDSINKRARLARARSRDHQQRPVAMRNGLELRGIQQLGVLNLEVALVGRRRRLFAEIDYLVGHVERILPRRAGKTRAGAIADARAC